MILTVVIAVICMFAADENGKNPVGGAFAGFLIGVVLTIIVVNVNPKGAQCVSKAQGWENVVSVPLAPCR